MNPTEYLIRRPAAALAAALLIVLAGAAAFYFGLQWRSQPAGDRGTVLVQIAWPGADAAAIERAIAQPAHAALAGMNGAAVITAHSRAGMAVIEVRLRGNADAALAMGAIQARLQATALPKDALAPLIVARSDADAVLIGITGEGMSDQRGAEIAAAARARLAAVPGVAQLRVLGGQDAVIRIGFDPARANALGVTIDDIERVLASANIAPRGGVLRGPWTRIDVQAGAKLTRPQQLGDLIIRIDEDRPVRISDVASVGWGWRQNGATTLIDGQKALVLAVDRRIGTNGLDFSAALAAALPRLSEILAPGATAEILSDPGGFDRDGLERGLIVLAASIGAAILAIWLMLGWWRAGAVPLLGALLVLAASCALAWAMGGSFNPITLLAAIIGMGLVADDAMAVVEDVDRQLREGKPPMLAPLFAARHLARPTLAIALTIAALFIPFALGADGARNWIADFALTLVLTALVSGAASLLLAPALCARFMRYRVRPPTLGRGVEHITRALTNRYDKMLVGIMAYRGLMALVVVAMAGALVWLWNTTPASLAPPLDRASLRIEALAPADADRAYLEIYAGRIDKILAGSDDVRRRLIVIGTDGAPMTIVALLKPAEQRQKSANEIARDLQPTLDKIAGITAWARAGGDAAPLLLSIAGPQPPAVVAQIADAVIEQARASGEFALVDGAPRLFRPALRLSVDRDKAATLGVPVEAVGRNLGALLGGRLLGTLEIDGAGVAIVLQAKDDDLGAADALNQFFLRTGAGGLVPLLELVSVSRDIQPAALLQQDGRTAVVLYAVPAAGVSLEQAADRLRQLARAALPKDFTYAVEGELAGGEGVLLVLAALALLAAYLVMAALVENFRDALAILAGAVPALFAALAVPALLWSNLDSFALIGVLCAYAFSLRQATLLHFGAVEFQAREGHQRAHAVGLAALQRLRPSLIGAVAMIGVLVPLVAIDGPGQELRRAVAWPMLSGIGIGTLLMLVLAPPLFSLLSANHRAPQMSDAGRPSAAARAAPLAAVPPMPIPDAPRPLRPLAPAPKPVRRRRKAGGGDPDGGDEDTPGGEAQSGERIPPKL